MYSFRATPTHSLAVASSVVRIISLGMGVAKSLVDFYTAIVRGGKLGTELLVGVVRVV